MKQFLRESWELWRWALFSPSKLRQRLNEWLPASQHAADEEDAAEGPPSERSARSPIADAFWFRNKNSGKSRRFLAQFAFVTLLSSVPLAVYCLAFRGPTHLFIAGGVWFTAFGVGLFSASLGLMSPLLLTFLYLASPSTIDAGLANALSHSVQRIALGVCAGTVVVVPASMGAEAMWRRNWVFVGWLILLSGTTLGFAAGLWFATNHDMAAVVLVTGMTLFFMLFSLGGGRYRRKDTSVFASTVATMVGLDVAFAHIPAGDPALPNAVVSMAAILPPGFIALVGGGFLTRALAHIGGERAPGAVAGALVGGVCGGNLFVILAGLFITLAKMPAVPFWSVAWGLGFAVAPARTSGFRASEWLQLLRAGRSQIGHVLLAFVYDHAVRAFLLLTAWLVALRFPSGWTALVATVAGLIGYCRILPDYPILALVSAWRARGASRTPHAAVARWLSSLPPYEGELIPFPLPGHARIFGIAVRGDPAATFRVMQDMVSTYRSSAMFRTFNGAAPEVAAALEGLGASSRSRLLTARLCAVTNINTLARVARPGDVALFFLAPEYYVDDVDTKADAVCGTAALSADSDIQRLFPQFQAIARRAEAAGAEELPFRRERALELCVAAAEGLKAHVTAAGLEPELASGWLRALEQWQAVLRAAVVSYVASASQVEVVQPFQSGNPIRADRIHLFKGRKQLAEELVRELADRSRPTVVLHGPRRCGKSSFLLNLSRLLPNNLIPVYIDMQSQAVTGSEADFCYGIVRAAIRDLRARGDKAEKIDRDGFRTRPYAALEDWLDEARSLLGARRLLICMDEFEKLSGAVTRGTLTMSLFDELRHLIQHREELSFIFCGAQILEEMGPHWSSYFINARPIEMHYLEPQEARELLEEPDPSFDLRYEAGIVEQVLTETSCQPYLLQLVGEEMVKAANRHHIRTIDQALLDEAFRGALTAGEIYFTNMWDESTGATAKEVACGRNLLRALAEGGSVPLLDGDETTRAALTRLERYRVINTRDGARIDVPLAARWIRERAR